MPRPCSGITVQAHTLQGPPPTFTNTDYDTTDAECCRDNRGATGRWGHPWCTIMLYLLTYCCTCLCRLKRPPLHDSQDRLQATARFFRHACQFAPGSRQSAHTWLRQLGVPGARCPHPRDVVTHATCRLSIALAVSVNSIVPVVVLHSLARW